MNKFELLKLFESTINEFAPYCKCYDKCEKGKDCEDYKEWENFLEKKKQKMDYLVGVILPNEFYK